MSSPFPNTFPKTSAYTGFMSSPFPNTFSKTSAYTGFMSSPFPNTFPKTSAYTGFISSHSPIHSPKHLLILDSYHPIPQYIPQNICLYWIHVIPIPPYIPQYIPQNICLYWIHVIPIHSPIHSPKHLLILDSCHPHSPIPTDTELLSFSPILNC